MKRADLVMDKLSQLTEADIARNLDMSFRAFNVYEAQFIALIGLADIMGVNVHYGFKNMAKFLCKRYERSTTWAYDMIKIGNYIVDHPQVMRSYLEEKITKAHVLEMTFFPSVGEADLLALAERMPAYSFAACMRARFERVTKRDRKPKPKIHAFFSPVTGMFHLNLSVEAQQGVLICAALKECELLVGQKYARLQTLDMVQGDLTSTLRQIAAQPEVTAETICAEHSADRLVAEAEEIAAESAAQEQVRVPGYQKKLAAMAEESAPEVSATFVIDSADADAGEEEFPTAFTSFEQLEKALSAHGHDLKWLLDNLESSKRYIKEDRIMRRQAGIRAAAVSESGGPSQRNLMGSFMHMVCRMLTFHHVPGDPATNRVPYPKTTFVVTPDNQLIAPVGILPGDSQAQILINSMKNTLEVDEHGVPTKYNENARCASDEQREALFAMYHHRCAMPLCNAQAFLEIHHIKPWSEGGKTVLSNLIPLCSSCHADVTAGLMTVTVNKNAPGFMTFHVSSERAYVVTNRLAPVVRYDKTAPDAASHIADALPAKGVSLPQIAEGAGWGLGLEKQVVEEGILIWRDFPESDQARVLGEKVHEFLGSPDLVPADPNLVSSVVGHDPQLVAVDSDGQPVCDEFGEPVAFGDDGMTLSASRVAIVPDADGTYLYAMDTAQLVDGDDLVDMIHKQPRAALLYAAVQRLRARHQHNDQKPNTSTAGESRHSVPEPSRKSVRDLLQRGCRERKGEVPMEVYMLLQDISAVDHQTDQLLTGPLAVEIDYGTLTAVVEGRGSSGRTNCAAEIINSLEESQRRIWNADQEAACDLYTNNILATGEWYTSTGYSKQPAGTHPTLNPSTGFWEDAEVNAFEQPNEASVTERIEAIDKIVNILQTSEDVAPVLHGFLRAARVDDTDIIDETEVIDNLELPDFVDGLREIWKHDSHGATVVAGSRRRGLARGWRVPQTGPARLIVPSVQRFPHIARLAGLGDEELELAILKLAFLGEVAVAVGIARNRLLDLAGINLSYKCTVSDVNHAQQRLYYEIMAVLPGSDLDEQDKEFYSDGARKILDLALPADDTPAGE